MFTDALLMTSGSITGNTVTPQTVTGASTTVLSTNTIDLGANVRDIGAGDDDLFARIEVVTGVTGGTSIEIQTIAADAANLTGNVTVIGTTGPIPVASLVAGARFANRINPRIASKGQRYLGTQYVIIGTTTTGAFVADYGDGYQDGAKFYPSGFSVT